MGMGLLPVILDELLFQYLWYRLCFLISILSHLQTPTISSLLTIMLLEEPNCKIGSKHLGKEWETKKLVEERGRGLSGKPPTHVSVEGQSPCRCLFQGQLPHFCLQGLHVLWFLLITCLSSPTFPQPYFFSP